MRSDYLKAGEIVNTHGIRGEVKVLPWCDSPEFLLAFDHLLIDDAIWDVEKSRVHGTCVLVKLVGANSVEDAMKLRGKTVSIRRADIALDEGAVFIADLIGLSVQAEGETIGKLVDVLKLPSSDVYVVRGEHEYMIPAVREFIEELNPDAGFVKVRLIEGMQTDE